MRDASAGGEWQQALSLARQLPRTGTIQNRAEALNDLSAELIDIKNRSYPAISSGEAVTRTGDQIRSAIVASEHSLELPNIEAFSPGDHLLPTLGEVYDANFIRALLSQTWLALSQALSTGVWDVADPTTIEARRLNRASHIANRAYSLVTPWCQIKQFAFAFLEARDVGYADARITRPINLKIYSRDYSGSLVLLNAHNQALETLAVRIGLTALPEVAERLRLSRERGARWAAELAAQRNQPGDEQ